MSQLICVAARNCYYTVAISGRRSDLPRRWNVVFNSLKKYPVRPSVRPSVRPPVRALALSVRR